MSDTFRSALVCATCQKCATHELTYVGRLLVSSRCTNCGHTEEQRDVWPRYLDDLTQRVRSKPSRMLRRFRRHPLAYASTLPRSVLLKPVRMFDELRRVLHPAMQRKHGRVG